MNTSERVSAIKSNTLSRFRTIHNFKYYGEIHTAGDYIYYLKWSKEMRKNIYILGNGSNTFFIRKDIDSLILKNKLPAKIVPLEGDQELFSVTSNVQVNELLNYCYKSSLDCFYYLASVPASIGGALAMNAGMSKVDQKSIYDYVECIEYLDCNGQIRKLNRNEMNIDFRHTMFTGQQNNLITNAIFRFPKRDFKNINPIKERILWAKEHQDNVLPNCGSVFKESNFRIMDKLMGFKVGKAVYSKKTYNWIKNDSGNYSSILILILIARFLHFVFRKKCEVEVIEVK